jgi:tetratricopeptide (TPR) repeat protein
MRRGRALLPCLLGVLSLAGGARAEVDDATRASARQLGYAGVEAFQGGQYESALAKLEKAYRVLKAPSLGLWSARALEKLGKLVEASERYLEVTRLSPTSGQEAVQTQAQADARREFEILTPRVPKLRVVVEGAGASELVLKVDGVTIAPELVGEERPVNPGTHRIEANVGAGQRVSEASLREGERQTVTLSFDGTETRSVARIEPTVPEETSDSHSGSTRRTLGWVAVVAGGAGIVTGGVTGGFALGKRGELESSGRCRLEQDECLPDMRPAVDDYDRWRTISTIGFVAGGVLATAGVVLLLTAPGEGGPRTAVRLSPRAVSLVGSF